MWPHVWHTPVMCMRSPSLRARRSPNPFLAHQQKTCQQVMSGNKCLKIQKDTYTECPFSVFVSFIFYYLNWLKSWLHKTCRNKGKTEIQHDSDEHQGIQIECSQTESVFFFFLCQLFVQKLLMRRAKLKAEQGKIPVQESHIIYKAPHVPSSQQVPFRLDVFLFPAEEIHFLLVRFFIQWFLLRWLKQQSDLPFLRQPLQDLEVTSVWFCVI